MLRMIHTQHGAYVGCAVFAYGTAKDRKKAIKSMKGELGACMCQLDWLCLIRCRGDAWQGYDADLPQC